MNPAHQTAAMPQPGMTLGTATPTASAPPAAPESSPPAMHAKAAAPALISLCTSLARTAAELSTAPISPPLSPSARSAKKEKRAPETRGQKRAIDGRDGPGLSSTKSSKRHKESTPPTSPRGDSSPEKKLVRSPRPVGDLKTMAGLSPLRPEPASPPVSPRNVDTAGRANLNSPQRASDSHSSSSVSGAPASSTAAPRWRSASHAEKPANAAHAGPLLSPRRSSIGTAPGAFRAATIQPLVRNSPEPAMPATQGSQATNDLSGFAFFDCDFGADGRLALLQPDKAIAPALTPDTGARPGAVRSITLDLIKAELLPMAEAQIQAANAYLSVLEAGIGDANDAGGQPDAEAFRTAQASLQTGLMVAEMILNQGDADDVSRSLAGLLAALAACHGALAEPTASGHRGATGVATAGAQAALLAYMESLENACTTGLALIADEIAAQASATSTTASSTGQARPTAMQSAEQLLDELDFLMDQEIVAAAPGGATQESTRQQ